jgi:gliding motility-associated-like protein
LAIFNSLIKFIPHYNMKHLLTLLFSFFILTSVAQTFTMNGTNITSCTGTFLDPGGAGNYANSQDFTVTICPSVAGSKVVVNFPSFVSENGWDFLYIYDGNTTGAPSLGTMTGTLGALVVQATTGNPTGCLTFVWHSDGSGVRSGWAATLSCTTPCQTINSVFSSSSPAPVGGIIKVCQGQTVTFNGTATFTAGVPSYSWNFDNGQTGAGASASTTYTAPGVYVVNLTTTIAGCTNQNKINQIVQVSTTPSFSATTTSTTSICLGQSATLIGSVTPTPFIANCTPPISGVTYLPDGSGVSYTSGITVDCYGSATTITSLADIANICMSLEHSFLDDLDIVIRCPNGQEVTLKDDIGGGGTYLGNPIDDVTSGPGTGFNYCFAMSGAALMINGPTVTSGTPAQASIAAGTYSPSQSLAGLIGCPLNGAWTLVVTDNATLDDGYIFNWDVNFNVAIPPSQSFTPTIVSQTWSGANITSTAGNNAVITPTATGTHCYTLTAVDNFGCSYTTVRCVTVTPGPYAGVNNTLTVCGNGATSNLFPLLGAGTSTTGAWTGPSALAGGHLGTFNPVTLAAGNYTYTVPGTGSCPPDVAVITVIENPVPAATLSFTNPSCSNNNGIIVINNTSPGGQTISSFASSLGAIAGQTVTGLGAGTPVITLTNNFGCTFTVSATLTMTPGPTAITTTTTNATCSLNNGSYTFGTPTGGTAPYTYAINGGAFTATSPVTGQAPGTYSITVRDANGCLFTRTVTITNIPGPTAIAGTTTQASCNTNNGTFNVTGVTGGTAAYTYSVNGVSTGSLTTGLAAGTHTILVRDANGCTFTRTFTIPTSNGPSTFVVNTTNSNCGLANGTSTVSGVVGGTPTYSFSFDGGAFGTGTTATGLTAGTHTVTVRDVNSCTLTLTYVVNNNPPPTVSVTNSLNVLCNGAATGSLSVAPAGGTAPFTYTLTTPTQTNTTGNFTGLVAGTYSVTVRDNVGCTATVTAVIAQPTPLTGTVSMIPVNCFGNSTGTVSAGGAGGTAPYTYSWPALGASTTATTGGAAAGTYSVIITDANLCTITRTVTVTQPTSLTLTSTLTPATCGNANGSGTVTVGGGTTPYLYNWSNGGTTATLTAAAAGTHTVTITDNNGCVLTRTVSITNIPGPTAIAGTTTQASCNTNNGTYNVTGVTGGTAAYTYSVDGVGTASLTTGLAAGTHTILVRDANGCTFSTTFAIGTANGPSTFVVNTTNSNCGLANGTSTVSGVVGGTPTYSFSFDGGAFGTGTTATGLTAGTHTVTVRDVNSCTLTLTYVVNNNPPPTVSVTNSLNVLCNGAATGSLSVAPAGGTAPFTYTLTTPTQTNTTGNFTGLVAGTYSVTVRDNVGCTATVTAVIAQPTPLTGTVSMIPVNCFGNSTGTVSAGGAGGTAPYTYSWPALGASTTATTGGAAAGTYSVIITDANLCTITRTVTVTQPTSLTLTSTLTPATCGNANGSGTVTVGGGTPGYTYNWSNGGLTNVLTAASSGIYTITAQDLNGCVISNTVNVTNIPGPTAITGTTTLAGCGLLNGTHNVTGVTGGTAAYTYSVDGVGTPSLTAGLAAGTHTILVRDANGCTFSTTFNINTANGPTTATVVTTNASCGAANGTATITGVTGGVGPYQYSFDGGAFGLGATTSGLAAGTHSVIIRDVNSCTLAITYTEFNNSGPTASVTSSLDVLCNGASTGSVTITAAGGTAPFTYTLTAPTLTNTTGNFTGLPAGTYNMIVSDNLGCTATASVTLTQPTPLTLTVTALPASCFGSATGTVSASGSGGVAPYTYLWPALASNTNATVSNVAAGTYSVTQTDANGCTITQGVTVTQPTSLTLTSTLTPATCGNANGSGTVTVAGGTPAYTYNWSNGGITAVLSGASAGTYTLDVTDFKGCVLTRTLTITNIPGPTALTGTTTLTGCGLSNGTHNVTGVTGGTAAYSYSVDGVSTPSLTSGLGAGTHTIMVMDANFCTFSTTFNINTANGPTSATVATTNANCGSANGTATVTGVTGGSPAYQYSFNGGAFGAGTTITGLAPGTHTLTVTDINSCVLTINFNVGNNPLPTASVTNSININCFGGSTGSFTVAALTGIAPFTYSLATPAQSNTSGVFTGLPAGNYNVTVSDNTGCTTTASVTLTEPTPLTLTVTSLPASCFGSATGTVSASGSGGVAPYTYLWPALASNTNATVSNVAAGTYSVTQTDANGCTITQGVTVTQPTSLTLTSTLTPATCGNANGSGTVTVAGGTPAYTYNWSNGGITAILSGASAGTYTLDVTDFKGCILTTTVAVTNIPGPTAITGTTTLAGCGLFNGTYNVTGVTGGTAAYSYSVDGVATGSLTAGLGAGTHTVAVSDANLCTFNTTFVIGTTAGPVTATVATSNASCGSANGTATVTGVTGGDPAYQYSFDGGAFVTGTTTTGLIAGTHTLTIQDANSCVLTINYNVLNNGTPTAAVIATTNTSCFGGNNGGFTAAGAGGSGAPFTYTLTAPFQTSSSGNFTGLTAGTYTYITQDIAGCTVTSTAVVGEPTPLTLTVTSVPALCFGTATGTVNIVGGGGTPAYTYSLNGAFPQTASSYTSVGAGSYIVTIRDANNCTATQTVQVIEPAALAIQVATQNANCTAANGIITTTVSGGTPIYTYTWSAGGAGSSLNGVVAGTYTVTTTDANGCSITTQPVVGLTPGGTASITAISNITCNGANDGALTANPIGGAAPYTYSWTPGGQTNSTATNLAPGTYTCEITDFYGCKASASATVTQPTTLTVIMNSNNVKCFGTATGTVTAAGTGGTAPYTYLWPTLASTLSTVPNVAVNDYSCIVTDANGCSITQSITVTEPTPIALTSTVTSANCNQPNGSATVTATGGASGAYTYFWSAGSTTAIQTGVAANTYTIEVTDANLCVQTLAVTIPNIAGPVMTVASQTNVSCFGLCDGVVTTSVTGGEPGPYVYSWSNGLVSPIGTNLCAQIYTVSVTDQAGCVASMSVNITEPTQLSVTILPTDPKCFGASNGFGIAAGFGGTPGPLGYSFSWSGGGGLSATSSPLLAGGYAVTVTDANNCTATNSMTLVNPPAMAASITSTNVSCFNACNGTAVATTTNNIGPVDYAWFGGASPIFSQTALSLCAGTYTMVATDQNSCTATAQVIITEPALLTANISSTGSVTCNGGTNGFAVVTPGGGTVPYTYTWTGAAAANGNSSNANNLPAGTYSVTVTDAQGCTATTNTTIIEPAPLSTSLTTTDPLCNGVCDGTGICPTSGGTGIPTFLWQPGLQGGNSVNTLCAGNQTLTITYNNVCTTTLTFTLAQPALLTAAVSATNSNCGQPNGSACATVNGGTGLLTYLWSGPGSPAPSTLCNNNIPAGAYNFVVTDANGCTANASGLVNDVSGPVVAITNQTNVTCFGLLNGGASATIAGGVPNYTISWSGTQATANTTTLTSNFGAGIHNITVTDAAGCVGTASVDISQPATFVSAIGSFTNVSCFGLSDGGATILVNGGTAPYFYSWPPSIQTNSVLTNVPANTYTGNITDANGCVASSSVIISQPQALVLATSSTTNISCFGGSNGQISTTVQGGTPGYTYSWTPSQPGNSGNASGIPAGPYTFTVTDNNNCAISSNFNITEPSALTSSANSLPATCGNANGSATVTVGGGTPSYTVNWNTAPAYTGLTPTNMAPGTWTATITDSNGCLLTQTVTVANPPVPTITGFVTTRPNCFGYSDGTIAVNYASGTAPYTVTWSNPISQTSTSSALTQSVAGGVASGAYTATLTDSYGCSTSMPVVVPPTPILTLVPTPNTTICYNQTTQLAAFGNGGTPPYSYTWTPTPFVGGGPHTVTLTTSSAFAVTVSDANGCSPNAQNINITVTPSLSIASSAINPICHGYGTFLSPTITSPGNGGPYSYSWTPTGVTTNTLGVTGSAPTVSTSVNYTVTVNDGCPAPATAVFTVVTNPLPTVNFVASTTVACAPATISFTAIPGAIGNYTYEWINDGKDVMGTTNPISYSYGTADSLDVTVIITNTVTGCFNDSTKHNYIVIHKQPIASFYAEPQSTSILDPNINFINTSQGAINYFWDFGDVNANGNSNNSIITNPSHYYNVVGNYNVHLIATSVYGCKDTTMVTVEIKPDFALYIPNAFTPDGNGLNDMFQPLGVGIDEENYRLDIFDRWGENIFTSNSFRKGWDGTVKGGSKIAEQGVYTYKMLVNDTQGNSHPYVGHVTLLKKEN